MSSATSVAHRAARGFAVIGLAVAFVGLLAAPASARMETSMSPSSGPVGTSITVKGTDYGADTVEIYWEADDGTFVLQGTATVKDDRTFSFTFKAPQGKAGNHKVKVTPKGSTNPNNDRVRPFKITTGGKAVEIVDGCAGVDHTDPEDPFTGEPIDDPSAIPVAASVAGAPEGASFQMGIVAPDGSRLEIRSAVDGTGRVAGATGISTFGTYVATGPIAISFTDPNTGSQVSARIDPATVFPADGLVVGPEEIACNVADLPPGTLLVVAPPTTGTRAPTTGTAPPATGTAPPVTAEEGGVPVIWILVIGGGVVLIGVGTVPLVRRRDTPPMAPPPIVPTTSEEGTVPTTQEKPPPPDPRGFDPKKQPFPQDDGIPWVLEWKLDALIWTQFKLLEELSLIGTLVFFGLGAIIGLLAAILAAIVGGFALLAGLLAGIFALLAFFVIRLVVPLVMEREREKLRDRFGNVGAE